MAPPRKYSAELRERAVRMVFELREQTGEKTGHQPDQHPLSAVAVTEFACDRCNTRAGDEYRVADQRPFDRTDSQLTLSSIGRFVTPRPSRRPRNMTDLNSLTYVAAISSECAPSPYSPFFFEISNHRPFWNQRLATTAFMWCTARK
jgi:hypothetical protein